MLVCWCRYQDVPCRKITFFFHRFAITIDYLPLPQKSIWKPNSNFTLESSSFFNLFMLQKQKFDIIIALFYSCVSQTCMLVWKKGMGKRKGVGLANFS
jgi:hypothetical protein